MSDKIFTNHPMTISGEKPLFWIDIDDPHYRTLTGGSSGDFLEARNKAGTSEILDFVQTAAANQPLFVADGFGAGLNSMRTDRTNGLHALFSFQDSSNFFSSELTLFMFIKFTALSVIADTQLLATSPSVYSLSIVNATSKITIFASGSTVSALAGVTTGNTYMITARFSSVRNKHNLRINMVDQGEVAAGVLVDKFSKYITVLNDVFPNQRCGDIDLGRWCCGYNKYLEDYQVQNFERGIFNYYGL